MKEQLINFETAKLAKEKGFDLITNQAFDLRIYRPSNLFEENIEKISNAKEYSNSEYERFQRPSQSLIQRWLREKHRVDIQITRNKPMYHEYRVEIYKINDDTNYQYLQINENNSDYCKWFNIYEDALENALQEALKLIK